MNPTDLLADLPPPRDDEPPSLRSDIVDELLDHLQCAFRREVLKDGDEAAAEQRVLDRFGDPKKLARRLWWQAMWSRVMGKRILSGLQWLVTLAALVMAGLVLSQQVRILNEMNAHQAAESHWRQTLSQTLNDLRSRLPASAAPTDPADVAGGANPAGADIPLTPGAKPEDTFGTVTLPSGMAAGTAERSHASGPGTVSLHLTQEAGSRDLSASEVQLVGRESIGPTRSSEPLKVENGNIVGALFEFHQLPVDRYELQIKLPDGQHTKQPVVIRDSKLRRIELECPPPRERIPVSITAPPLPPDLQDAGWTLSYQITEAPVSTEKVGWDVAHLNSFTLIFDPKTGQLMRIQENILGIGDEGQHYKLADVSQADPTDRAVFLLTGPVTARFQLFPPPSPGGGGFSLQPVMFPTAYPSADAQPAIRRMVEPDVTDWKLDLPEELLAAARKQLEGSQPLAGRARGKGASKRLVPDEDDLSAMPGVKVMGGLPGQKRVEDLPRQLTVKLESDNDDGPSVDGTKVTLRRGKGLHSPRLVSPSQRTFGFVDVPPDRYTLDVVLPDGQHCTKSVVIQGDKPREMTVDCPGPREKALVAITAPPLPEDLRAAGGRLSYEIQPKPIVLGETRWLPRDSDSHRVEFDPATGKITAMYGKEQSADLSSAEDEDRVLFLISGPVTGQLFLSYPTEQEGIPLQPVSHKEDRMIAPGENQWEIKVPEEFWAEARKALSGGSAPGEPRGDTTDSGDDSAVVKTIDGDECRLIVKLTSETKDGPVPEGAKIVIRSQQGKIIPIQGRGGTIPYPEEQQGWIATVESGRYTLGISFPDGRHLNERLPLLRPGQERELHIVCPLPVKQGTVLLKAPPVPEEFRQRGLKFRANFIRQAISCDGHVWQLSPPPAGLTNNTYEIHNADFDPETGLVTQANGVDFTQDPPEDRILLLRTGVLRANYTLIKKIGGSETPVGPVVFQYPPIVDEPVDLKPYEFELTPGDNTWTLKLDDFWAAAKEAFHSEKTPQHDVLEELENEPSAKGEKTSGLTLTVKLVQEDNSPVGGAELTATAGGKHWQAESDKLFKNAGKNEDGVPVGVRVETGKYHFFFDRPDHYVLTIKLQDGQMCRLWMVVKEKEQEFLVVCPPPRDKVSMLITAPPLPDDLQDAGFELSYWIVEEPVTVNSSSWNSSTPPTVLTFDSRTGEPKTLGLYDDAKGSSQQIDLRKTPLEERLVFLPSGPVGVRFNLYNYQKEDSQAGQLQVQVIWPPTAGISKVNKPPLPRNVDPDETRWKLELPEELLTQVRKKLAEKGGVPSITVEDDDSQPQDTPPGDSPGAKTGTDENRTDDPSVSGRLPADKCRVIVKFVSETADGPPPEGMKVSLLMKDAAASDETDAEAVQAGGVRKKMKGVLRDSLFISDQVPPGRYEVSVRFPDGRFLQFDLPALKGGQQRYEEVVCPPPVKLVTVKIAAPPVPDEFHSHRISLSSWLKPAPIQLKGREWTIQQEATKGDLQFDWKTGTLLSQWFGPNKTVTLEDSEVVLPEGTYELLLYWNINLVEKNGPHRSIPVAEWPGAGKEPASRYTTKPGENVWEIEVPDDFWDAAREKLTEALASRESRGDDESATPEDKTPGDSPEAKTETPK